jgi:membrane protein
MADAHPQVREEAAKAARFLFRPLRILWRAILSTDNARGLEAAATMAFFALFSLFPLLLLIVVVGGTALENRLTNQEILEGALELLPVSRELIRRNIVAILDSRGTVGIIGAIGLLWASTSVFTTLTHNLGRAWPDARSRGIVKTRLAAVLQVVVVLIVLTSMLLMQTIFRLPAEWRFTAVGHSLRLPSFASTPSRLIFSFVFVLSLLVLYHVVPNVRVRWREAFGGALVAAGLIHGATALFVWYLGSGLARYNLVYGSLGALLALMTWAYITSLLILFGAHVASSIARDSEHRGAR